VKGAVKQYQVDHLLLLVGSNPVPNAVAGKLLVKPGGTITLICSKDSLTIAQRLKSWFEKDGITVREPNDSQVDPADPSTIFQGVQLALSKVNEQRVGLNYTGGTKAMSVHAYRAVESWCEDSDCAATFSYLDASKLQMIFDPEDFGSGQLPRKESVGLVLQIKLEELIYLHDWEHNREKASSVPTLPTTASLISNTVSKESRLFKWKQWVNNFQRGNLDDAGTWPEDTEIKGILDALREELQTCQMGLSDQELRYWIQGKWLEDVVLSTLKAQSSALTIHECVKNLETIKPKFELDVAAMRGYQLFAFSCDVKSRSKPSDDLHKHKADLKKKLFEVFVRARQLGGDEARVALVCLYEDPEGLEHEMKRDVDAEGRIRVFGYKNLARLNEDIKFWIETQSRLR
jgi:hypothetical protein